MNFIPSFTLLLLFQLIGTSIQWLFALAIPGSVIGMVLLFSSLVVRKRLSKNLQHTSLTLLYYMPLLFIPAGVGVMQEFALIKHQWLPISAALIGSCMITLIATGLLMQYLLSRASKGSNTDA